ncbi:uroporphyrinogen-III synthase [Agromyces aureus]|uniref:Uroporphyrinogen III synthetase n=1 Tax=Agromyces aureus TaxID=453304 RepID=A0A191WET2_9MICO|nr:uroporphyrinogen-III synthase [Agromyces aureus]ANJ26737.1 uroporphyrinogen III synthetase [Agromyces aureus]
MSDLLELAPGFRVDQLVGFRIGVTSDRRSADLIDALARRGASVVHAPTLRMTNALSDDPVIADTRAIIEARPEVLLATTAYGIRRWFEVADSAGLGEDLLDALADTAILVRGPKARGGIRAAGLNDVGMSAEETTESLIDHVLENYPPGLTVAVQLHGFLEAPQLQRLSDAHDRVITVAPYRWVEVDETDDRVERLIEAACTGGLDAITFTSAPAVHALFGAAEELGRYDDLVDAMCGPVVAAAVGPVTAVPLIAAGITPIQPDRFRMGALIRLVCEYLETNRVIRLETQHGPLALRGSVVDIADRRISLAPVALMILRMLVLARGSVVARDRLAAGLPGTNDEHALEVALSRLRQTLAVPGLIATVVKRGYRIDV